ncbi:MAG: hypothetical protein NT019_00865 [Candidatus Adlerbacteria bacterium]|nr:hypothetical protein [Candidatus Adlerbacteria bacterium]
MSDIEKKFHEFALKSILFKGRNDWYFCYLKSEKIAHVLVVLAEQSVLKDRGEAYKLALSAAELPQTIVHFAAGEVDPAVVVADIFSLLSKVRLAGTSGLIAKENIYILLNEYETVVERFSASIHPSPFTSSGDFAVPNIDAGQGPLSLGTEARGFDSKTLPDVELKDNLKRQSKGQKDTDISAISARTQKVLDVVISKKSSSIKDISAAVRGCSEKTIQRELAVLIERGLVKKVGERRWSVYMPI